MAMTDKDFARLANLMGATRTVVPDQPANDELSTAQPQGLSPALRAQGDEGLSTVIDEILTAQSTALSPALRALRASYYPREDVMYVSIADAPAVAKHGELGLVLRYDPATEEPIGVTIIDFAAMWEKNPYLRIPVVDVTAKHLKLPRQPVYEALRNSYHEPRGLSAADEPTSAEEEKESRNG